MKKLTIFLGLFFTLALGLAAYGGQWTPHGYFYKPSMGASGQGEYNSFNQGLDQADASLARSDLVLGNQLWPNDPAFAAALGAPAVEYISALDSALAAIALAGNPPTILHISKGTYTLTGNTTIPSCVEIRPERGALFILGNYNLTINGTLDAGRYQVFSCTGTGQVSLTSATAFPEWFGAAADTVLNSNGSYTAGTDNAPAFQAMYNSLPVSQPWKVSYSPGGIYYFHSSVNLPAYQYPPNSSEGAPIIEGNGATLYTDQPISILKKWPPSGGPVCAGAYAIENLSFVGTSLRAQVGLDLGATFGAKIDNCFFNFLGIGLRMSYCIKPIITNCFANYCVKAGFQTADGYGLWASSGAWPCNTVVYNSCHAGCANAVNVSIQNLSRANPCQLTWTSHGLSTGDIIFISGIANGSWTALNNRRFYVTVVDANTLSLSTLITSGSGPIFINNLDTSGYATAYTPSDGYVQAGVFGWMCIAYEVLNNCIAEQGNPTDNVFQWPYTMGRNAGLFVTYFYDENRPYGAAFYLNGGGGSIYDIQAVCNLSGTNMFIDAYDGFGLFRLKDCAFSGTIRIPQDNPNLGSYWQFTDGNNGAAPDYTTSNWWYNGGIPNYIISEQPQNSFYFEKYIFSARGLYLQQDTNFGDSLGQYYPGLMSQANSAGGGGVSAYDSNNGQLMGMRELSAVIPITSTGSSQAVSTSLFGIPAGVQVQGFTARVLQAIGGCTSWGVQDTASTPVKWLTGVPGAVNTPAGLNYADPATAATPRAYPSGSAVNIVATGGSFNGTGQIRLTVHYIVLVPPAS